MTTRQVVLLSAAVLFLWSLGGHDLWAPDEPYYGEIAREMLIDGQWAVTHSNGEVTTDKPPLFPWLIALFSWPFGAVGSWTARLPSALAGLGTVLLTMRLGTRLYGAFAGTLAGGLLATTFMFWDKARWAQPDALLCLLIWVALSAFEAFRLDGVESRRVAAVFWAALGLSFLVKWPVGIALVGAIAVILLVLDRDLLRGWKMRPVSGTVVVVGIIGAWVLFAELAGPPEYSFFEAFNHHFISRALEGVHHERPPWYYLTNLPPNLMPWTALLPGAFVLAWRRRRVSSERLPMIAFAVVLLVFSISTEKRELYALPAVPAIALMLAALVAAACRRDGFGGDDTGPLPDPRWVTVGQGIVGGLLLLISPAPYLARAELEGMAAGPIVLLSVVLGLTGVSTLWMAVRRRVLGSVLATGAGIAVLYLVAVTAVYPAMEPRKSARPFALRLAEETAASRAAGYPVLAYDLSNLPEPFAFYSDGVYTIETGDIGELERHLRTAPESGEVGVWAAANASALEDLPADLVAGLEVVERARLSRRDVVLLRHRRPASPEAR